jgi:hypothetical protein
MIEQGAQLDERMDVAGSGDARQTTQRLGLRDLTPYPAREGAAMRAPLARGKRAARLRVQSRRGRRRYAIRAG